MALGACCSAQTTHKPVQQGTQQALRAYCPNIYTAKRLYGPIWRKKNQIRLWYSVSMVGLVQEKIMLPNLLQKVCSKKAWKVALFKSLFQLSIFLTIQKLTFTKLSFKRKSWTLFEVCTYFLTRIFFFHWSH